MKTILITGCAGFIGSHLTESLLEQEYNVIGIDNFDAFYDRQIKHNNLKRSSNRSNFHFIEADICNKNTFIEIKQSIDVVIHIAAKAGVLPSINDATGYINTNIQGTNNILEFIKERKIKKMLFASSSSVYGNNKVVPFSEEHPVENLISPYAFTKRSCELMNHVYHHLYGIDIINLRFFTVYGPRQRPDLAIHKFVKLIDSGKEITMYGAGDTARDYTYINDTVSGIVSALSYLNNNDNVFEIINLGNNQPVKLIDLINTIYKAMDIKPNVKVLPMQPGDVDITFADISKAEKLLGYVPKTSINEGIRKFINWYYEQKN